MEFDRLNNIEAGDSESVIDIDKFFGSMDLTAAQKEERIIAAKDFYDFVLFVFAVILARQQFGFTDFEEIKKVFKSDYSNRISTYMPVTRDLSAYVEQFTENEIDITQRHLAIELASVIEPARITEILSDSYYLSEARAVEMAVNMSLDVVNYKDFITAIERGFRHKKWISVRDKKTRKTHDIADGQTIPIGQYFKIGKARLAYPHDTVTAGSTGMSHLEEIVNCRCSFRYVR